MRNVLRSTVPLWASYTAVMAAAACTGTTQPGTVDAPAIGAPTALPSPATAGSGEPSLFAVGERVHMTWIEPQNEGHAVRFATLDGAQWSPPTTVVDSDSLFVNWADFPTIAELADGTLAAHWLRRSGPSRYAYDIAVGFSGDGGATWSDGITPHRDGVQAEHGFVSLVAEPAGGVTAVWLDGRNAAGQPEGSADMTLRTATIDVDGQLAEEHVLDARTCDCCQTSAARLGESLLVAYRDRSPDEVRDIWAVRRDASGWHEPVRVAQDDWMIPGCPVNGPAIAAAADRGAIAWFTLGGGAPQIKVVFTDDEGRSFGEPLVLERGSAESATLGRVDAEWIDADTLVVSWLSQRGDRGEVRYRTVTRDGRLGDVKLLGTTSPTRASGFPRLARDGNRLVAAWTVPGADRPIEIVELKLLQADAGD